MPGNAMARKAALVLTVVLFLPPGPADLRAQSSSSVPASDKAASQPTATAHPAGGEALAIKVSVNTVLLNASVRDRRSNRSIGGLQLNDFRVYEDGVLQQLQHMTITDVPYNLLLLMDVSGSTWSYMKLMKKAATEFTREIGENDRVAVAKFNSKVHLVEDFTPDLKAAGKTISRLHSGGGTAFYDALMACVDKYMRNVDGRKAIVVFTDGVDNVLEGNPREGSRTSFRDLFSRLQETDILIYTIFLNSRGKTMAGSGGSVGGPLGGTVPTTGPFPFPFPRPFPSPRPARLPTRRRSSKPLDGEREAYRIAREQLAAIAGLTGGRMYAPLSANDLSSVYSEIADDLRLQYVLTYVSSNPSQSDQWRTIHVDVIGHPEAAVRTRKGYAVNHVAAN